jgi:NAD(P)-dependent dehydrogenase (short-subunit alcohol dehydrogenase family)
MFNEKVALVTGAGGGIGAAVAQDLAARGARVLVVDLNGVNAEAVAADIRESGGRAVGVETDVSSEAQCEALVRRALDEFGALHFAVNNAGVAGKLVSIDQLEEADWRRVMGINLDGVFYGMKHQLPAIEASSGGAVVNTASIYAHLGLRKLDAYTASKHAVLGLTRSVAIEYATRGVRVNVVLPGPILTPLTQGSRERAEAVAALTAMKRMGQPMEVAKAISFLLSPDASFITGTEIVVDGGVLLS